MDRLIVQHIADSINIVLASERLIDCFTRDRGRREEGRGRDVYVNLSLPLRPSFQINLTLFVLIPPFAMTMHQSSVASCVRMTWTRCYDNVSSLLPHHADAETVAAQHQVINGSVSGGYQLYRHLNQTFPTPLPIFFPRPFIYKVRYPFLLSH